MNAGPGSEAAAVNPVTGVGDEEEASSRRLELLQKLAGIGYWEWDVVGGSLHWSEQIFRIYGISPDGFDADYQTYLDRIHPVDREMVEVTIDQAMRGDGRFALEHRIITWNGDLKYVQVLGDLERDEDGRPLRAFGTLQDVTARKRVELQSFAVANGDAQTGLPNANRFLQLLRSAHAGAQANGHRLAVVHIGFRQIRQLLLHNDGATIDRLIRQIVGQLEEQIGGRGLLARQCFDEFLVLVDHARSDEQGVRLAGRIERLFAQPVEINGRLHYLTPCIGVAFGPLWPSNPQALLSHAATALEQAALRGGTVFYEADTARRHAENVHLENELQRALQRDQFTLAYQPQVDLRGGAVVGAEVLIRWHHPRLGWVSPARFIPAAERSGLIVDIGAWVLETACAQFARWRAAGRTVSRIALNLSARQLAHGDLVRTVERALGDAGMHSGQLELEVTERMFVDQTRQVARRIAMLHEMGVGLAIDDFGTGYSSLDQLSRLPASVLKIDKRFVDKIPTADRKHLAITRSIVELGRSAGLRLLAEGIEHERQMAFLRDAGCHEGQGYLFGQPMSAEQFAGFAGDSERSMRAQVEQVA